MQTTISTLSPAKLNLFLHINGERDDGYHNLQTVFHLLNWGDDMRFVIDDHSVIHESVPVRLHCDVRITDDPLDNLIVQSAYALLEFAKKSGKQTKTLQVINIYLHKKIPTGAGLGGGSSNAATTLMALNQLWKLELTSEELQKIGATLGADVPIFIYAEEAGSAIAEGIGDIFTPIVLLKQRFLLLMPSAHISTAQLFSHPNLARNIPELSISVIITQQSCFIQKLANPYSNVFQPVVCELSKEVAIALSYLQSLESTTKSTARMTGSGSCVFLPIANELDIDGSDLQSWIANAPCSAVLVDSL